MAEVAYKTPWVRLVLEGPGTGGFVGYEDSAGRSVRPPAPRTGRPAGWDFLPEPGLWWAARSTRALFALAGRLPVVREGMYGGQPVPLAVLVDLPTDVAWTGDVEERMRTLLRTVGLARQRFTLAAAVRPAESAAFRLPFDVGVVGPAAGPLAASVAAMLSGISPDDLEYGMRVHPVGPLPAAPLPADLDVLVTPPAGLSALSPSGPPGPRLIVLDDPAGTTGSLSVDQVPAGSSVLTLPAGTSATAADMTRQVLWALTHDWPLHEAVRAAGHRLGLTGEQQAGVRLMTSPEALDGFRLLAPFERMRGQAREVVRYRGAAVERPPAPEARLRIEEAVERAGAAVAEFHREADGFTEVVAANAALDRARPHVEALARAAAGLAGARRSALEHDHQRRVAIWLEHDPLTMGRERVAELGPRAVLGQGRRYVLNVGIGIAWPTDLVPRDSPAVDPILPPVDEEGGHDLTVTVFSPTSRVLDQPSKPLRLGRLGPSLPVTFLVETPRRRRTTGLRVVLYYRGHIVQSFRLTARLAAEETFGEGGLAVALEFSRRERLADLDELPERALCVVTNDDPGGAHAVMFEPGDRHVLDDDTARTIRGAYQKTLEDARTKLGRQAVLAPTPFAEILRRLAAEGHDNFKAITTGASRDLLTRLAEVRDGQGRIIQIVRTRPSFAHPWVAVYDWKLPRPEVLDRAPICLGAADCTCTPTSARAVCVNGFWGVRHVVEELLVPKQPHVATVAGAPGVPSVVCTVGTRDDWSTGMVTALLGSLGNDHVEDHAKDRSLLERLWDVAARPAVLVVLGHLETKPMHRHESEHPRILVSATEGYLDTTAILETQLEPAPRWWEQPLQPIVLLLGCNTARSGLGSVHDFVQRLAGCGAATVIATEESIDTRLAGDVANAVVPRLDAVGPGEALRAWRAGELGRRNPLGFVLTCFGSADVTVPALRS